MWHVSGGSLSRPTTPFTAQGKSKGRTPTHPYGECHLTASTTSAWGQRPTSSQPLSWAKADTTGSRRSSGVCRVREGDQLVAQVRHGEYSRISPSHATRTRTRGTDTKSSRGSEN